MKWDSIKSRLLLMTMLCVLGMVLMTANQHYFGRKLSLLSEHNVALQALQTDLLQLRRHEKDFLLRKDTRYITAFDEQKDTFIVALTALREVVDEYELPANLISDIAVNTEQYARRFKELSSLFTELGLTSDSGVTGELRRISAALNNKSSTFTQPVAGQLNRLSYLTLDYQITLNNKVLEDIHQIVAELHGNDSLPSDVPAMLTVFLRLMDRYASIKQQIGWSENEGLRGAFRTQAHQVESDLASLDNAMQPVLLSHREQATLYSTAIAVLTSVALILLLIKSFATFHRSFANFVLFFYRCKRQYQRIDPRKLGFSEFRSLAALANEMVESRRQIELRLAKLESAAKHSGESLTT